MEKTILVLRGELEILKKVPVFVLLALFMFGSFALQVEELPFSYEFDGECGI